MQEFRDPRVIWDEVVAGAPTGWFWGTRAMHEFRLACIKAADVFVEDASFVLVRDGRPVGLAPLVFCKLEAGLAATYFGNPLPWPMALSVKDEAVLFDELERRIRTAGVGHAHFILAPPTGDFSAQFGDLVRKRSMVDISYRSHCIDLGPATLGNVRERYRRYVRKFQNNYTMSVLAGTDIPADFAVTYMELHARDAGRSVRPLHTYELQANLARIGEGFFVTAHHRTAGRIVGALLISLHKGAAYDHSVAVDPEFQDEQVSNLLKWRAVEHMLELGVKHYELGSVSFTPSYIEQPSAKNYGISFFKEGWSRDRMKMVLAAEKFYSQESFDRFWEAKRHAVSSLFFDKGEGDRAVPADTSHSSATG